MAMLVSILLMACGSFATVLLPTFATVGWLAPTLLLIARVAQGISLGGEVSNASANLVEIAAPSAVAAAAGRHHRGDQRGVRITRTVSARS